MRRRQGPIDEQRLGGPADAGAAKLRIQGDVPCHAEIGAGMHVDMANAFEMGEDRHARLALHALDEALAAARHDDIDRAVEAGKHGADRAAVARRDEGDRLARQPRLARGPRPRPAWIASAERKLAEPVRRIEALPALEAKRARVGHDIGPALEDHADDAERRGHAFDDEAVRPLETRRDAPDRIGKGRDLLDGLRDREPTRFVETQAVEKSLGRRFTPRLFHVERVGGEDERHPLAQRGRHGKKGRVLFLRGRQRDLSRGGAGASA